MRYPSITADSRYENEEAYTYLRSVKQKPYTKPQTYKKWKKQNFKQYISKCENMDYDEAEKHIHAMLGKHRPLVLSKSKK